MSERLKTLLANFLMILAVITLNIIRKPELLHQPRFFAEEGTNFFQQAFNNSFIFNLLNPQFGYYTLYNVIATSLASAVSLEYAPFITTYIALAVQVLASAYVIWGDIPILDTRLKRFIVAISFPLLCPGQIWLTTIGVQYWLALITFLIILERPSLRIAPSHYIKAIVLIFNGMTGVLTCFMMPVFLYKFIRTRSWQFLLYTFAIFGCSIIQLTIYFKAYFQNDPGLGMRLVQRNGFITLYDSISSLFCSLTITPTTSILLMSNDIYYILDKKLSRIVSPIEIRDGESIVVLTSLITIIFLFPLMLRQIKSIDMGCILLSVLIVYLLSVLFSVNSIGGNRYVYAPSVMLFVFVISSWNKQIDNVVYKILVSSFVFIVMISHVLDFRTLSMEKAFNTSWPRWEEEVNAWKMYENYPLRIWPPPWAMNLRKR